MNRYFWCRALEPCSHLRGALAVVLWFTMHQTPALCSMCCGERCALHRPCVSIPQGRGHPSTPRTPCPGLWGRRDGRGEVDGTGSWQSARCRVRCALHSFTCVSHQTSNMKCVLLCLVPAPAFCCPALGELSPRAKTGTAALSQHPSDPLHTQELLFHSWLHICIHTSQPALSAGDWKDTPVLIHYYRNTSNIISQAFCFLIVVF